MKYFILILSLFALESFAQSQLCDDISWDAVTLNVQGEPVAGPVTYRFFVNGEVYTDAEITSEHGVFSVDCAALPLVVSDVIVVTAVDTYNKESAPSNEVVVSSAGIPEPAAPEIQINYGVVP